MVVSTSGHSSPPGSESAVGPEQEKRMVIKPAVIMQDKNFMVSGIIINGQCEAWPYNLGNLPESA
jgi:hypothetical protein